MNHLILISTERKTLELPLIIQTLVLYNEQMISKISPSTRHFPIEHNIILHILLATRTNLDSERPVTRAVRNNAALQLANYFAAINRFFLRSNQSA